MRTCSTTRVGRIRRVATLVLSITICATGMSGSVWADPNGSGEFEPTVVRFGTIDPPVVVQRDITVDAPAVPYKRDAVPIECSGIAWIGDRLLMTSDRHEHLVFTCAVDTKTMRIGLPKPVEVIRNQQNLLDDAEAIAVRPSGGGGPMMFAYAMCSLSNDKDAVPLAQRRHLLWFVFDPLETPLKPRRPRVIDAGTIRQQINSHFIKMGVHVYHTFNTDVDRNTYRWGNVEGMAMVPRSLGTGPDPKSMTVLFGMRNPLIHNQAVVAAVLMPVELGADQTRVDDLFVLDLGGRGIADICWDPVTRGYLIVGARSNGPKLGPDQPFPPNSLDAALFWWSGRKTERPIRFADVPDMKIEAVCRIGNEPYIAFVSDEGDVSEGRAARQSVLTVMHFIGVGGAR